MNRRQNVLYGLGWLLFAALFAAFVFLDLPIWMKICAVPVACCLWVGVMLLAKAALNIDE